LLILAVLAFAEGAVPGDQAVDGVVHLRLSRRSAGVIRGVYIHKHPA
jgi:hypothetical protein